MSTTSDEFLTNLEANVNNLTESGSTANVDDVVREAELRALFDTFLPDWTSNEFDQVNLFQKELRSQQARLTRYLNDCAISEDEYLQAVESETEWSLRRCAEALGDTRFEMLFGSSLNESIHSGSGSETDALLSRYQPGGAAQDKLVDAVNVIDPQSLDSLAAVEVAIDVDAEPLVETVMNAERLFRVGDIEGTIFGARRVVREVLSRTTNDDISIYLSAWAYHVEGRAYESLGHWSSAENRYDSSLTLKQHLVSWLPVTVQYSTEVKLGGIQVIYSPAKATLRLQRVLEKLTLFVGYASESRIVQNLIEDTHLNLARSHFATGRVPDAVRHAQESFDIADHLLDHVGKIRSCFVLFRANQLAERELVYCIDEARHDRPEVMSNPNVRYILRALEQL